MANVKANELRVEYEQFQGVLQNFNSQRDEVRDILRNEEIISHELWENGFNSEAGTQFWNESVDLRNSIERSIGKLDDFMRDLDFAAQQYRSTEEEQKNIAKDLYESVQNVF